MYFRLRGEKPLTPGKAAWMSRDSVSTNLLPHSERSTISLPMSQYMRTISAEAFWTAFVRAC